MVDEKAAAINDRIARQLGQLMIENHALQVEISVLKAQLAKAATPSTPPGDRTD